MRTLTTKTQTKAQSCPTQQTKSSSLPDVKPRCPHFGGRIVALVFALFQVQVQKHTHTHTYTHISIRTTEQLCQNPKTALLNNKRGHVKDETLCHIRTSFLLMKISWSSPCECSSWPQRSRYVIETQTGSGSSCLCHIEQLWYQQPVVDEKMLPFPFYVAAWESTLEAPRVEMATFPAICNEKPTVFSKKKHSQKIYITLTLWHLNNFHTHTHTHTTN